MAADPSKPGLRAALDGWLARLRAWPSRRIADPDFRRWAERHWLTRPVARRQAKALFDLVAGFVYSQVLLACVQLQLFERLAAGPASLDDLAQALRLPPERARCLLNAAVALRLLASPAPGSYALGTLGAAMVGNDGVIAMVKHHPALYADLRDPVALLRGESTSDALAQFWPYASAHVGGAATAAGDAAAVAAYSTLMTASQPLLADLVLDACPLERHRCLLDVGGGEAAFLIAAGQRHPHLQLRLFDLPGVAERAHRRLAAFGMTARSACTAGDFFRDPLPTGADAVSLVRVVHDHDDAAVQQLLRAVHAALPPGGTLLLAEPMAGTAQAPAMGDAYFGWYLLAMGSGRPRTAAELSALLRGAGFVDIRQRPTRIPLQTSVLTARRPGKP